MFDFGKERRFQCKVLRELEKDVKTPLVIRSVEESSEHYPEWEEYEEDDEDDIPDSLTQEEIEKLYAHIPLSREEINRIHEKLRNHFGLSVCGRPGKGYPGTAPFPEGKTSENPSQRGIPAIRRWHLFPGNAPAQCDGTVSAQAFGLSAGKCRRVLRLNSECYRHGCAASGSSEYFESGWFDIP